MRNKFQLRGFLAFRLHIVRVFFLLGLYSFYHSVVVAFSTSPKAFFISPTTTSLTNQRASAYYSGRSKVERCFSRRDDDQEEHVDIAIVGAGIGGLCAGAILNTLYKKKVGIYEAHYLAGGCAHAFNHTIQHETEGKLTFTFDSGPTIVLGCSRKPYNPLRQVLNAVGLSDEVEWIPYHSWGMIEHPKTDRELRWKVELGPNLFEEGPLSQFGGEEARKEFQELRLVTKELVTGAIEIPAMAMRCGDSAIIPLLRYLPALIGLIQQGEEVTQGTFKPYMDGPKYVVKNRWLRNWLDALAFSLSGLPASRTSAAAMAYVLYDMHREGAALDYPRGGLGVVIDALVKGVEQGDQGSRVNLGRSVQSIDTTPNGNAVVGLTLQNGRKVIAKEGVICNASLWSLSSLIKNKAARDILYNGKETTDKKVPQSWNYKGVGERSIINIERNKVKNLSPTSFLENCDLSEQTGSFLHLHVALDAKDLNLSELQAHYTVMDRGISGCDDQNDGPCGELNMIAVSNPCAIDHTLAPSGYIVIHAYAAGNECYDLWDGLDRNSSEYKHLKEKRADVLWRAIESVVPDAKNRCVGSLIGSPLTHERFLRRPRGTYGAATEDYLKDGRTPLRNLVLCGDGIFPGIGVPAVALSGASAANAMVSPIEQWFCLDELTKREK